MSITGEEENVPGFNEENGKSYDRLGLDKDENGYDIPEHKPLFIKGKHNQKKYRCMCNGKDGVILKNQSSMETHCNSKVHKSWLLQRENNMKPTFQLVKVHYEKLLKKCKDNENKLIRENFELSQENSELKDKNNDLLEGGRKQYKELKDLKKILMNYE